MAYYLKFDSHPLSLRQKSLKVRNIFQCFCQACKENWGPLLSIPRELLVSVFTESHIVQN